MLSPETGCRDASEVFKLPIKLLLVRRTVLRCFSCRRRPIDAPEIRTPIAGESERGEFHRGSGNYDNSAAVEGLHRCNPLIFWRPQRDSNPRYRLESVKHMGLQVLENTEKCF
jgi:hypothetical protein